jgi:uncharacterized membrane-anchored protein
MRITDIMNEKDVDLALLKLHRTDLSGKLETAVYFVKQCLAKADLILERENFKHVMSMDERLDAILMQGNLQSMVRKLEKFKTENDKEL